MNDPVCKACGERLPVDAHHCGACGLRLGALGVRPLTDEERRRLLEDEFVGHAETLVGVKPPGAAPEAARPRRRLRRVLLRVEISYGSEHNFYTGATENISTGGLFVATDSPLETGQRVEARFSLPGAEEPFSVPCVVRWVRPPGAGGVGLPGMGLAFESLAPEVERTIDAFLVHREPVLYED